MTWTTFAGLILLEYADIGFSTCDGAARCHWDIGMATESVVLFLSNLFEMFPERKGLPLWVAGESFAGNLVSTIMEIQDLVPCKRELQVVLGCSIQWRFEKITRTVRVL